MGVELAVKWCEDEFGQYEAKVVRLMVVGQIPGYLLSI